MDSRGPQGQHQGGLIHADRSRRSRRGAHQPDDNRPRGAASDRLGSHAYRRTPLALAISVGRKGPDYKDTAHNILDTEEYVIHIADTPLMGAVHDSSVEHPPEVSEVEELNLETRPSERVKVPRLAAAPVAMECVFRQCLEFGEARSRLIVGEVVMFHIRDGLVNNGKVETEALDPIARIGGPRYARLGEIVTLRGVFQTPKSTD